MSAGNDAQNRIAAEQIADTAITRFTQQHPEFLKAEIPPPLKWAGAIFAALLTTGVAAMAVWLVSSVSDMQVTLARIDERSVNRDAQYSDIDERVRRLESYHSSRRSSE
ncbi:hypothetical protein AAG607_12025 [Citromicrobium bathyomarinum]|uniref:hypothetical protein n=1 Tax=Citromicrobium bathyomarinum TaxID=72174 RepID=UPI00315A4D3E